MAQLEDEGPIGNGGGESETKAIVRPKGNSSGKSRVEHGSTDGRAIGRTGEWKTVIQVCRKARTQGRPVHLSLMVICETVWVLSSLYAMTRQQIALAMQALLDDNTFVIEETGVLNAALKRYQVGKGDLSDYLICLHAQHQGAKPTYTFDKVLHGESGFQKE